MSLWREGLVLVTCATLIASLVWGTFMARVITVFRWKFEVLRAAKQYITRIEE